MSKNTVGLLAWGLFSLVETTAQDLASWSTSGVNTVNLAPAPYTFTASTPNPNVASGTLRLTNSVTAENRNNSYGFIDPNVISQNIGGNPEGFIATLTAAPGAVMNVTGFQIDLTSSSASSSNPVPYTDLVLRVTVDGNTKNVVFNNQSSSFPAGSQFFPTGYDLTQLQDPSNFDLTSVTSLQLRFLPYNDQRPGGARNAILRIGDGGGVGFSIQGTAIPEISTVVPLLGLLGLSLLGFRRRV